MARPSHVGNEKYLARFWIVEALDLDVALKLATEGSKAGNRRIEVRRNAAKAAGRAYGQPRGLVKTYGSACDALLSARRVK